MVSWGGVRREIRPLITLALPLVLGEFGWMMMSVVDSMMVGRVSKEAMGAVSLGGVLFYAVAVLGMGMMLGLDALVSQAFGAGDRTDCHHSLVNALWIALPLAPVLMAAQWAWIPLLPVFGVNQAVVEAAGPYVGALIWSTPPLLVYAAFRRYLQGMNQVKVVMFALVSANVVNALVNWVLVFGNLGFSAMGAEGAGWATVFSRVYMAGVLVGYAYWWDAKQDGGLRRAAWRPDWGRIRVLAGLGFPASMQIVIEVGVFALATTLIGKLDATSLAAHQIAINAASFSYMVPLGLGSAAAVRVGQGVGSGDWRQARDAGWTAIGLGVTIMGAFGVLFVGAPRLIGRLFTPDETVIDAAVILLALAALFQLFDGAQGVATGALRGAGNTRIAAVTHLGGYWVIGLPLGYWLCFGAGWGAAGLWTGLCVALMLIGIVLAGAWAHLTGRVA
ncbi:MAG: MATE family efflux transporter [Bryobacterales bacterium]|nr:MATE family efflux transporter [Bryobacterales bacterium]